jgi:hypothetical protein
VTQPRDYVTRARPAVLHEGAARAEWRIFARGGGRNDRGEVLMNQSLPVIPKRGQKVSAQELVAIEQTSPSMPAMTH